MKTKRIIIAALLAVLCAGFAACSTDQSTSAGSASLSDASTSSTISSDLSASDAVSSSSSSASVSSAVSDPVSAPADSTEAEGSASSDIRPPDQMDISEEQLREGQAKSREIMIQAYMNQLGMTREEAEAQWDIDQAETQKKREEALAKRAEMNAEREAEEQAHSNAIDQWYRENTGMSRADWLKLSIDERTAWVFAHPDVDFSTSPEFQ